MQNPRAPLRAASSPLLVALCCARRAGVPAGSGDEVTIMLVGDVGLNRSNQPVEADGVRRGGFQTWADTTSLIDKEINGDLNFMNVETVVTDRNDLPPDTQGAERRRSTSAPIPTASAISSSRGFNLLSLANNHSMDYGVAGPQGDAEARRRAAEASGSPSPPASA